MSEDEIHHSFASLKRRFEQNRSSSSSPASSTSVTPRSSPAKYNPREGTARTSPSSTTSYSRSGDRTSPLPETRASSARAIPVRDIRPRHSTVTSSRGNGLLVTPRGITRQTVERKGSIPNLRQESPTAQPRRGSFESGLVKKPDRPVKPGFSKMNNNPPVSAEERMKAKKQAMISRMAEMDSEFGKKSFPDFPSSKLGQGLRTQTSSGGFLHNSSVSSQQKTVTKISGTRTVIQGSTTRKVSSTTSSSTSSQQENMTSQSVTSTTTSSQVVRRKIEMSGEVERSASPDRAGTGWLFKEGSNRQDFLTQAMHSRKQFVQEQKTVKKGATGDPEGVSEETADDEQIFDDVIITRDPSSKPASESSPPDDYYIHMDNTDASSTVSDSAVGRLKPVPAPRSKSDVKTMSGFGSNKSNLLNDSKKSSSLPVGLTNGRSPARTTPLIDSESENEEQRYEPVECFHQDETNQFSQMTKVTSQSGDVTEKKTKGRKISAFKQFKSGIINKFSSVEKREERKTTSATNLDSPDSGVESDVKVPRTSVQSSVQSHQASVRCTTTADDSFESGGLDGMSDDSLHTSMMKALSLDAKGRPMIPPRDSRALALRGINSDSDDESITGLYIDPHGGIGGGPRLSPRPGCKSHMVVQASSHYSVTKDGDTQGESKHCYMELDDEGVIQRLQRSQRYQSRFGDVAPLYQDFHSVYNRLPALNDNRSEGSAVYDIAEEQPLYLTYDACAPTYMPYFDTGSTASDEVVTDVEVKDVDDVTPRTEVVREEAVGEERVAVEEGAAPVIVRTASQRNTVKGSAVRKLWSEMPEVMESGILEQLTSAERKLQEAYFEVITSEASYLKSLNILIDTFLMSKFLSPESGNITRLERHHIFSNIISVMETSERFLAALEARWSEHFVIDELCDIIRDHAKQYFEVYVVYCTNQIYQIRTMDKLLKKKEFREGLLLLERDPRCQLLPMKSFLLLPMQRITRLPLLLNAIYQNHKAKNAKLAEEAALIVGAMVRRCNDGARNMERMEQMVELEREIKFDNIKKIPMISSGRYLVKRGDLLRIIPDQSGISSKIMPGRKAKTKQVVSLFLFNDLIVFTRKKSLNHKSSFKETSSKRMAQLAQTLKLNTSKPEPEPECNEYVAFDYCSRIAIEVDNIPNPESDSRIPDSLSNTCKNVFILAIMENHAGKQVEMILNADTPSDQARWIELLAPAKTPNKNEKVYEKWDCPTVKAAHKYVAQQPDELSLKEGDEIKVTRKMGDGWYEGERTRDCRKGWFPSTFCSEITSDHLRMKNLRQRYRVNVLSKNLLDQRQGSRC